MASQQTQKIAFRTPRLVARDFVESDFERLHTMGSDLEVTRFTSFGPNSREETAHFLRAATAEALTDSRRSYSFGIELRENGLLIGSAGFAEPNHGQYEIGYILGRPFWGRGLGTELVMALVEFAFVQLSAEKIWAPVDAQNVASSRVLEKAGFRQEGLLRSDRMKWPEGRDTKLFGLLVEEWQANVTVERSQEDGAA